MRDPIMVFSILVRFGAGRRVSLYNQLQPLLDARLLGDISAYVERAREHDRETLALEDRWDAQQYAGKHSVKLSVLDPIADRLLSGVHQVAEVPIIGLPPEHPLAMRVRAMQDDLFPAGVHAVTTLSYVDQVARMETCMARLTGKYAPLVQELGMNRVVERLAEVTRDYRVAVDAGPGRISFEQVDAMRTRGHVYLFEIVAMIAARFHDADDPDQAEARAELLAPVIEHNAAVMSENRSRRSHGSDADEEPGTEPDGADADGTEPAGADADGTEPDGADAETADADDSSMVAGLSD